jgi:hypothetical protein
LQVKSHCPEVQVAVAFATGAQSPGATQQTVFTQLRPHLV